MPLYDLSEEKLAAYRPERTEPSDFDAFWSTTLDEARAHPLDAVFTPVESHLGTVEAYDVEFSGFGGDRVKGWLLLPRGAHEPLPAVVEYIGYGGGRGFPHEWLLHSAAGRAHLVMDTRGQGSGSLQGATPDREVAATGPAYPGYMTRGLGDPDNYYYRRLITDAVRAVEAARSHPRIDAERIVVAGGSQGGGLSLAVSGLVPDLVGVLPDVPFLCHWRRALDLADSGPYLEIRRYLTARRDEVEQAFRTLGYFDGVNFATRANAPALFSVALLDHTCPPSTVYAAYNHYAGADKEIRVWTYNDHEGGAGHQKREQLRYLTDRLGAA